MTDLLDITAPDDQSEGTFSVLKTWLKQPGDPVAEDEPIAELETDKVTFEVVAPADGTMGEFLRALDDEIEPGAAIARMAPGNAAAPAEAASKPATSAPNPVAATPTARNGTTETRLSPAVRRLTTEHSLNPAALIGTGRGGRLTKDDVLQAIAAGPAPAAKPAPVRRDLPPAKDGVIRVPHSSMRRKIAEHMQKSVSTAPHVTALFEMDLTAIAADRKRQKPTFATRGVNLTYTAYFVRATVEALRAVPEVNSQFHEDHIDIFEHMNIGIGTSLGDKGLVVPVIHGAEDLNLFGIASRLQDVTTRAKSNALKPKDVQGGTFSISNHGVSGSLLASPIIINQPQSAILGLGKMEKRVTVEEVNGADAMVIRLMAYVTLTIDHRVIDGHQTNHFLSVFTNHIENWPEA